MNRSLCGIAVTSALALPASAGTVLYDATLGTLPEDQGWVYPDAAFGIAGFPVDATRVLGADHVTLDTTPDRDDRIGFFSEVPLLGAHPGVPSLDRTVGFTLRFDVRIDSESHIARDDNGDGIDDRAGFSVIVVTSDLAAIELGFWEDEVWAYDDDSSDPNDLFTHAEGAPYDTTSAVTRYDLTIKDDGYTLRAAGSPILAGPLRDYAAFTSPIPLFDPYETPDLVFLGDDTGSADSVSSTRRIQLIVPSPGVLALLVAAGVIALPIRRR